jgi:hypothetical protein
VIEEAITDLHLDSKEMIEKAHLVIEEAITDLHPDSKEMTTRVLMEKKIEHPKNL